MARRKIQIHYRKPNGDEGVINYLTSENNALLACGSYEYDDKRKHLIQHARSMIVGWHNVFPDDRFFIAEV